MDNKRRIPYGVINWAKLVRECHFVDTAHIRELERVDTPVFLRPKRFGKSIVCSMLAHYYDVALGDRRCACRSTLLFLRKVNRLVFSTGKTHPDNVSAFAPSCGDVVSLAP